MAEARSKHDWTVECEVVAAIYNTIRDPKRRKAPFSGNDFNPHAEKRRKPARTISIREWSRISKHPVRNAPDAGTR